MTNIERFWSHVRKDSNNECWIWLSSLTEDGYGIFWIDHYHNIRAHRYLYELVKGKIPDGLVIDHLCRNPKCVNPNHLEAVTNKENLLRGNGFGGVNSRKTHCKRGHELTPENIYGGIKGRGRDCKLCKAVTRNERHQRRLACRSLTRQGIPQ